MVLRLASLSPPPPPPAPGRPGRHITVCLQTCNRWVAPFRSTIHNLATRTQTQQWFRSTAFMLVIIRNNERHRRVTKIYLTKLTLVLGVMAVYLIIKNHISPARRRAFMPYSDETSSKCWYYDREALKFMHCRLLQKQSCLQFLFDDYWFMQLKLWYGRIEFISKGKSRSDANQFT